MKFSLFEEEFKNEWESSACGQTQIDADSTRNGAEVTPSVFANDSKAIQKSKKTGVGPLNKEPERISLLSHFSFTFLIVAIVTGALAGAGYYFRDSALADTVINKYLDYQIESGLVGHWTFDGLDMTATTVIDKSGNGNTGTLNHLATSSRISGKIGQALLFNRFTSTQYVDGGSASMLDDLPQKTYAAWVKPTSDQSFGTVITKEPGFTVGGMSVSGTMSLTWQADFSSMDGWWNSITLLKPNQWQHIVVTYDKSSSSNNPVMYIDGVLVSSTRFLAPSGSYGSDASRNIEIGGKNGVSATFDGAIDDVRIYNRILSQKEITRLYKLGEGTKINVSPNAVVDDGLVGHWTFDGPDITGTSTVLDSSPNHATGTMVNMATSSRVSGKHGQALNFVLGSDHSINVAPIPSLSNITQKSLSMWIKPRTWGQSSNGVLVDKDSGAGTWALEVQGANLRFYQYFNSINMWTSPASGLYLNRWSHILVTYDNSSPSNDPLFYINGAIASTTLVMRMGSTVAADDSTRTLHIGNHQSKNNDFDGLIDDVRIYNRILSADEIAELYHAGEGVKQGRCGTGNVRDADGNFYNILEIGTQCWLDRNMNVGTRIDGATSQTNNATTEKYCYDDTASNCTDNHPKRPDGGLYQWDEAMQYVTTEGARGICPAGWHIPTDAEWYTLENYLKTNGATCNASRTGSYDCSSSGVRLKPSGNSLFEGNFGGYASGGIGFTRDSESFFWTSVESGASAYYRRLASSNQGVYRYFTSKTSRAHSVRCIKD